jgi:hypothetical protein
VDELISYLVVAEDYEASLFACQSVLEGETGIASVASDWKIRWRDAITHGDGISELLGREFSPVDGGRKSGQPRPRVLSSLDRSSSIFG